MCQSDKLLHILTPALYSAYKENCEFFLPETRSGYVVGITRLLNKLPYGQSFQIKR